MKHLVPTFLAFLLTAGTAVSIGTASPALLTLTPANLKWVAGTGVSKGSSLAVMWGNPDKSGNSIIRVKMPDGYTNTPHYHSHPEIITVMQGTLLFGTGDKVDKSKAKLLPAGSFIMVPAGLHHWSVAQGDTIEQVGGEGPLTNIPVKNHGM